MDTSTSTTASAGLSWLALVASAGTLVCCALPIVLVTLGLGATVAALTSSFPILVTLSMHKAWIFAISGTLMLVAGWLMWRPGRACPTDPALAARCARTMRWNRRILWLSSGIWAIGFVAAYLALPLQIWLDR